MEKEKTQWTSIIAIVGLVLVCIVLVASQAERNENEQEATLVVSGTSELSVDPDQAIIYINVLTEESTAEQTQTANKEISNKVMNALKAAGIDASNIETSDYYLYKKTRWEENEGVYLDDGYSLTHTLKVTTTDIDNIGSYIDASIKVGANGVANIQFTLTKEKEKEVKATALIKATTAAKEKAQSIATSAGVQLDDIMSISENSFGYMPYYANVKQEYDAAGSEIMVSNIAPQKVDVSTSISITYTLENKD